MDYNNNNDYNNYNNQQNQQYGYNQQPYGYQQPQQPYGNQQQPYGYQPNQQPYGYQQPQQPYGYQQQSYPQAKQPGHGLAVSSLVLGIISLFVAAFICGTLAIIFGCVAKNKGNRSPMATAGIVCGAIGVAAMVILMIAGASVLGAFF